MIIRVYMQGVEATHRQHNLTYTHTQSYKGFTKHIIDVWCNSQVVQ